MLERFHQAGFSIMSVMGGCVRKRGATRKRHSDPFERGERRQDMISLALFVICSAPRSRFVTAKSVYYVLMGSLRGQIYLGHLTTID